MKWFFLILYPVSSVAQSCSALCDPMDCSSPGFPVLYYLPEFSLTMSIELVMPFNHLILWSPLFLLPSIFPSIRVFSYESVLCIKRTKYWRFTFSINPSSEYSGLISFRIDWLVDWLIDSLAVQGTLGVFSNTTVQKHQFFGTQLSLWSNSHIHTWPLEKP